MKKTWITWIVIIGVLALLAIPRLMKQQQKQSPSGKGPSGPVGVNGLVVHAGKLNHSLKVSGNLLANEEVELHCEASGRVVAIHFEEGKPVQKGQLLVKLFDGEWQALLRKSESRLKLAEDMERRQKELLQKEGVSKAEYDMAVNELNAARADKMQAEDQVRKTEMIAPFSGVVGLKYISEGAYVTPATRIASLQDIGRIKIEFAIPERYAATVHIGAKIRFKPESDDNWHEATIYAIEPHIDAATRNLMLRASCTNDGRLLPGSFASVEVTQDEKADAIMIPTEAVVPILKGQKVYVLHADSVAEQKIETGLRTDTEVEVKSGLKAGDTLVTTALMQLKQGAKVKILKVK